MSERKFLSFIITDGVILTVLGLLMLTLPKITEITFGYMLCITLIIYGGYKAITSFLTKNFKNCYILSIINALLLCTAGILMFFTSIIDMILIVTLLGIYFILESIINCSFTIQIQTVFQTMWKTNYFIAAMQLFFGILLILFMPTLWMGGVLIGLNFILSGVFLLNLYFSKKYLH